MASFIQVLGNCQHIIPPQLLIVHNNYRFLVNAGENTQRFCLEHRVKLSRISDVFLTHIHPSTISGLPGLLLTLETEEASIPDDPDKEHNQRLGSQWFPIHHDHEFYRSFQRRLLQPDNSSKNIELKKVRIWGPPPLLEFMTRTVAEFAGLRYIDVEIHEFIPSDNIPNSIILPPQESQLKRQPGCTFQFLCPPENGGRLRKRRRLLNEKETPEEIVNTNTLIIRCQFPQQLGKMDNKKLDEMKIPKGPWLSQLKSGESITLKDGRTITPDEVCSKPVDGHQFVIWGFHQDSIPNIFPLSNDLNVIFDLSPPSVVQSSSYSSFISSISTIPIFSCCNSHISAQPFVSSTCLQSVLRSFIPDCFPLGVFSSQLPDPLNTLVTLSGKQIPILHLLDRWVFSQLNYGLDQSERLIEKLPVYPELRLNRLLGIANDVDECRKVFRKAFLHSSTVSSISSSLLFLGTGAAMPSKYRNVSGTLLKVSINSVLDTSILMDCGEGSLSQIFRFSSSIEEFESVLESLSVIFISHRHADHHLGLPAILESRYRLFPNLQPPLVVGPLFLLSWLNFWSENVCPCPHVFICCEDGMTIKMKRVEHLINLKFASVDHIQKRNTETAVECYGVRIDIRNSEWSSKNERWDVEVNHLSESNPLINNNQDTDQWKSVVYSGDTRPCCNLIDLAKNCDVLIHEGTFEDDFHSEAVRKHHSTISESLNVGSKSNSKYLLITHFSQRYPGIPSFSTTSGMARRCCVVFDSLNIELDRLFQTDDQGGTFGECLSDGMKLLKPILSVLRD